MVSIIRAQSDDCQAKQPQSNSGDDDNAGDSHYATSLGQRKSRNETAPFVSLSNSAIVFIGGVNFPSRYLVIVARCFPKQTLSSMSVFLVSAMYSCSFIASMCHRRTLLSSTMWHRHYSSCLLHE
jgi:hypothetical protein